MRYLRIVPICVISCGLMSFAAGDTHGAKKSEKADPARDAVEKVLLKEVDSSIDRREELAKALRRQPDSELIRWQSGYVRVGKAWRGVEDALPSQADAEKLDEYFRRRDKTPRTVAGQLELADWCRKSGLRDQERTHLLSTIYFSPGNANPSVYERLGYRQVGNQWMEKTQLKAWHESNERALAAVKKWEPLLAKIAEQAETAPKAREGAFASLRKIASRATIPAIEYVLCGANEPAALLAVRAFGDIPEFEGTEALAKQAVFSKWSKVRGEASIALKGREFDQFVPTLVRLLERPAKGVTSKPQIHFWREGAWGSFALISSYVVARETDDQFRLSVLRTVDYGLNQRLDGMVFADSTNQPTYPAAERYWAELLNSTLERTRLDIERGNDDVEDRRTKGLSAENDRIEELNDRIIRLLASVSGRNPDPEIASWWRWWDEYSDLQSPSVKPVIATYEDETFGDRTSRVYLNYPKFQPRPSCFRAGTSVWTGRGPLAIEKIKIGDLILSQDVETGELSYKPVIATSVREPQELVQLKIGKEMIECTGGHRFWVSGKGWVKARDLSPATRLHTVRGNASVVTSGSSPATETYNLVVADSHSYFVGEAGLLVQDLPMPRSSNRVVPGLARRMVAVGESRQ